MTRILLFISLLLVQPAFGAVDLVEKDDWKVDMSGFVETDLFYDSTRSFTETIGNTPVNYPKDNSRGRTQMSIRNSRLAFNVQAPVVDDWKSRGYFEFDLMGFDPNPPSTGGVTNSEGSFFNNPTLRVRHVYLNTEKNGWQFLAGQTWNLFGWQPYYFIPTLQVAPIPGMLYGRTAQIRGVKSLDLTESSTLQLALGIMRPPQRDGNLPAVEAGARWALNSWAGAFTGGSTGPHKPQPLSVGVTGTARNFEIATDKSMNTASYTGMGAAIDTLIPIIPSRDGKDSSNNLVLGGEFTVGQGYGDQFASWSGNLNNPLSSVNTTNFPNALDQFNNLDAGIGGFENGSFALVNLQTFNVYLQYHLPESWATWVSAGYSQLYSNNIGAMDISNKGKVAYEKEESYFANVSHDCTKQIRVGFEYANVLTTYVDGTAPQDNRFQTSAWFIF